jgi:hypothetical protein
MNYFINYYLIKHWLLHPVFLELCAVLDGRGGWGRMNWNNGNILTGQWHLCKQSLLVVKCLFYISPKYKLIACFVFQKLLHLTNQYIWYNLSEDLSIIILLMRNNNSSLYGCLHTNGTWTSSTNISNGE